MPNKEYIDIVYIQILTTAGFVHDISPEVWDMIQVEIKANAKWIAFEDIYGGEIQMPSANIDGARRCDRVAREKYHEIHNEESFE